MKKVITILGVVACVTILVCLMRPKPAVQEPVPTLTTATAPEPEPVVQDPVVAEPVPPSPVAEEEPTTEVQQDQEEMKVIPTIILAATKVKVRDEQPALPPTDPKN